MKKKKKILLGSLLSLPVILGSTGLAVYLRMRKSLPLTQGELKLKGLKNPVSIKYDEIGAPHIKAESLEDAYFAQGFVTAQDRLVQMEIMRRISRGQMAEIIGKLGVEIDRFMRTIGLHRGAAKYLIKILPEDSRNKLSAYINGVNAYIENSKKNLPIEFALLGYKPEPWTMEEGLSSVLFMIWTLDSFWTTDLMREKLYRKFGVTRAIDLLQESISQNPIVVNPEGSKAKFPPAELAEEINWDSEDLIKKKKSPLKSIKYVDTGSNNWVVNGTRTKSGFPILANDPHIQHSIPTNIYLCHLQTPEANIIGASFPGIPGIVFGHNDHIAWGITSLCADVQDLFIETFQSEDSDKYLAEGKWVKADVYEEEIKVRFGRSIKIKILETRNGPIIKRKGKKGLAIKWSMRDYQMDTIGGFFQMNQAKNWDEFTKALEQVAGPTGNIIYADRNGNIGYYSLAKIPVRAKGDGTIPVPGDNNEYNWKDVIPFDKMPHILNPEEGFIVTANNKIVGESYPYLITKCWETPFRAIRIAELIKSKKKLDLKDMQEIQSDIFTYPGKLFAKHILEAAKKIKPEKAEIKAALDILSQWDFQASKESVAHSIYYETKRVIAEELLIPHLGEELYHEYITSWPTIDLSLEKILSERDKFWLPSHYSNYDELIMTSLEKSLWRLRKKFKTRDISKWKWGKIHKMTARHYLGLFWPLTKILNIGPLPRDGDEDTINASPCESSPVVQVLARGSLGGIADMPLLPNLNSDAVYAGPLLRMVIDLSNWDKSVFNIDVGQSSHRLSQFYKNQFDHWYKVKSFPMLFTEEKINEAAIGELKLLPE